MAAQQLRSEPRNEPWPERRKHIHVGSRIAVLAISVWPGFIAHLAPFGNGAKMAVYGLRAVVSSVLSAVLQW
jgi:hypothetical protein